MALAGFNLTMGVGRLLGAGAISRFGRTPVLRVSGLTAATGVPAPFVIAWSRAVSDCATVEAAVHRLLDDRRVSGRREFFRCDVKTACQVIEAAAGSRLGARWRMPARRAARGQWQGRGKGRRRGRDLTGFGLAVSGAVLIALLVVFQPRLPSWLPAPVAEGLAALERLHGP